ncbi:MAG: glutamate 5-kinase, partial [Caldilineales bacterium]|nr:glutamate 5-kinase [Caldilineales bacterium]
RQQNLEVVLVSSGAIGAGMACFGWAQRPKRLPELQAAAAVGQCKLMAIYDESFQQHGLTVAQILLTHADLKNRTRHLNAKNTLLTLLKAGVIPIINENDTVSVDEIRFGDNDQLGALTAALLDVDLFVILSHIPGLCADRHARDSNTVIPLVESITPKIEALAGGTTRATSVGGMKSKIAAAKIVTRCGIP